MPYRVRLPGAYCVSTLASPTRTFHSLGQNPPPLFTFADCLHHSNYLHPGQLLRDVVPSFLSEHINSSRLYFSEPSISSVRPLRIFYAFISTRSVHKAEGLTRRFAPNYFVCNYNYLAPAVDFAAELQQRLLLPCANHRFINSQPSHSAQPQTCRRLYLTNWMRRCQTFARTQISLGELLPFFATCI
jgi:hypothetical protein